MKQPSLRHRRALRTFIVAVIMILANATAAWAQSAFSGGDGTSGNPFQIASVADLRQLATDVNSGTTYSGKYFKLINDIDFYQATDTSLRPTAAWNVESTQNTLRPSAIISIVFRATSTAMTTPSEASVYMVTTTMLQATTKPSSA